MGQGVIILTREKERIDIKGVRIMMTFLFSLFSLIAAAVSFAGYKTIFKIEENDEDVADVVSAKVASHKHDANNGMAASH